MCGKPRSAGRNRDVSLLGRIANLCRKWGERRGKWLPDKASPQLWLPELLRARGSSMQERAQCPAPLTSPVRLPRVVFSSEGNVIELGALQLAEVLGTRRAVLRGATPREVNGKDPRTHRTPPGAVFNLALV